jgi:hypothetical protein
MRATFYHYQDDQKVEKLDLMDHGAVFSAGRQINKAAHAHYSAQLNNKGKSKIAFTDRDH